MQLGCNQRIRDSSECSTSYRADVSHQPRRSAAGRLNQGRAAPVMRRYGATALWRGAGFLEIDVSSSWLRRTARALSVAASGSPGQQSSSNTVRASNSAGQQQQHPNAAAALQASAAGAWQPPAEVQKQHKVLLREMARDGTLRESLLDDKNERLRQELGIPENELKKLLSSRENNGAAILHQLRPLLYSQPPLPGSGQAAAQLQSQAQQHALSSAPASSKPTFMPEAQRGRPGISNGASATRAAQLAGSEPSAVAGGSGNDGGDQDVAKRISIRDALNQQRIFPPRYAAGTYRMVCPKCKGGSKHELSFSVTVADDSKSAQWHCFRATCGYAGTAHVDKPALVNDSGFFVSPTARKRKEEPPVRPTPKLEPLTAEMHEFFVARGISTTTLERNGVAAETVYDFGVGKEAKVIAFPYYRDSALVNVKYRTLDKRFWQAKGAEKVLYGLNDVAGSAEIVIVEGEMDKLALEEAGFKNVVSVPDGAPARVREGDLPPAAEDTKYSYLWKCRAWLDQAVRVVIATDNDAPGDALAEELARRLGRERCWRVRWPLTRRDHEYVESPAAEAAAQSEVAAAEAAAEGATAEALPGVDDVDGVEGAPEEVVEGGEEALPGGTSPPVDEQWYRKDANEVLLRDGPTLLRSFVEAAEPLPIRGLLRFHEYYDDIVKHYYLELRDGQGVSTGWPTVDQFYKVVPGELTIVTGVPNSGKSEWIDALLCNLTEMHGWTFALCSMEKRATDHARQLAEKYVGRPFFDLPYARGMQRMTYEQLDEALDWVDDRFHLIRYEDEQLPSVDWVLDIAKAAVYRYGIRGLVIDPYNELDHQRPASMNETEYVSRMLTKVKRFAQTAGVHVWFVAHPRQLREWKGQAPNLYDISGSAHFINKADNGVVVHRTRDANGQSQPVVQILVRKVRNKAAGTVGDAVLEYERINGRYVDPDGDTAAPRTSQPVVWDSRRQAGGPAGSSGAQRW